MFCRNCAQQVSDQAVMCVHCGVPPKAGTGFCSNCGAQTDPQAVFCVHCGVGLVPAGSQALAFDPTLKSKMAAGLLGVFIGAFGVHRFYLGYTGIAVAQLVLGLLGIFTCGITTIAAGIWGLVEGIMILTGSINKDAQGKPLRE
jgi:TM2 domain-containing membrane protein YozV/ribosomal protein L40E